MSAAVRAPRLTPPAENDAGRPRVVRLVQLALTLLAAVYVLFIGGTFDAGLRYRVQLLNTLLGSLVGLAWLGWHLLRGDRVRATGLEWPLVFFALSQWLALATSAQPRLGLEWVASVTVWCAALVILHDLLRAGWPHAFVLNGLMLMGALVTAEGLLEVTTWYADWLRLGQWPPVVFRLNGLLGHANLTATFLNLLWPIALARAAAPQRVLGRAAWGAQTAAMLAVLFFTSSRAGWLAAALALAALAALVLLRQGGSAWQRWRRRAARGRWLMSLAGLAVLAAVAALLAAQSQHITHGPLFSSRQTFWMVAWRMFQLQPLTGAGPDLFTWFYSRWVPAPPQWFAPHAHSLIMQLLGGSGLIGLAALAVFAAASVRRLWQHWQHSTDPLLLAGCLAGLAAVAFQHVFDYLLGSTVMVFVVVVVLALALTAGGHSTSGRPYSAAALWPALVVPLAVAAFALRGAAWNDQGLALAAAGDWPAAARAFERAAQADPRLTLYWQHAAYAYSRAGEPALALPLWQRAAHDDPYWPLLPASVGVLSGDRVALQTAQTLNQGRSALFALNEGALAEGAGQAAAARLAFKQALDLQPAAAAALFWQQAPLRQQVLDTWLTQPAGTATPAVSGEQALAAGQLDLAQPLFEAVLALEPGSLSAHVGLAQVALARGDLAQAARYRQEAQRLPVVTLEETLALRLLAGDIARASGDPAAAAGAYAEAFSMINDYTVFGPGTYGYPQRSWYVYRRASLPSDLIPAFVHADITAVMDERFAWLADWFAGQGQRDNACYVAGRVWREAPQSLSGDHWRANCE
jgi:tetratricopeptide (TPR) repeat protein